MPETTLDIYCDGGARGNPGPAAASFVVKKDGHTLTRHSVYLGETTNNVAEYQAVIAALRWLKSTHISSLTRCRFFLDSTLVVSQLKGDFKIKHPRLKMLSTTAQGLIASLGVTLELSAVPRDQNSEADALVNRTLDRYAA